MNKELAITLLDRIAEEMENSSLPVPPWMARHIESIAEFYEIPVGEEESQA